MKECIKDCLSCSNCFIFPKEDEDDLLESELFCIIKKKYVFENETCEEWN